MATRKNGTVTHASGNDKNYRITADDGSKYRFKDETESAKFQEGQRITFDVLDGTDLVTNVVPESDVPTTGSL